MNCLAALPPATHGMTQDRVEWMLYNWSQWMHGGKSGHLRAKTAKCWSESGYRTSNEMLVGIDKRCAAATDACIDALPTLEKVAIYAMHMQGPWNMDNTALSVAYRSACGAIGRNLWRRGIG